MAYQTFRVEITRDETRDDGPVGIEITAYIDRMPETNEATIGRLSRASRGVWNSRLQYTSDFAMPDPCATTRIFVAADAVGLGMEH
jgi:hypothetical protein